MWPKIIPTNHDVPILKLPSTNPITNILYLFIYFSSQMEWNQIKSSTQPSPIIINKHFVCAWPGPALTWWD